MAADQSAAIVVCTCGSRRDSDAAKKIKPREGPHRRIYHPRTMEAFPGLGAKRPWRRSAPRNRTRLDGRRAHRHNDRLADRKRARCIHASTELADRRDLADATDFDQFAAEPVPQRAFRSQFFQQRLGPLGRLTGELRLCEQLPPTARYFLFGEQSSTLCQQPRDAASCLEPSSIVGGSRAAAMSGEHVFHGRPHWAPPRATSNLRCDTSERKKK